MLRVRKTNLSARFAARALDCAERAAMAETDEAKREWLSAAAAWRDMAIGAIEEKPAHKD